MIAEPKCSRCDRRMVWIGIGPGAEPACSQCKDGPPCPQCKSRETEPFRVQRTMWSMIATPDGTHHCGPCGHVWVP